MTFAGGPGNNYGTHALATMVDVLRDRPGTTGLITGLGWYVSKHSIGLYGTEPPTGPAPDPEGLPDGTAVESAAGFAWGDPQAAVGALPQCAPDSDAHGEVTSRPTRCPSGAAGPPSGPWWRAGPPRGAPGLGPRVRRRPPGAAGHGGRMRPPRHVAPRRRGRPPVAGATTRAGHRMNGTPGYVVTSRAPGSGGRGPGSGAEGGVGHGTRPASAASRRPAGRQGGEHRLGPVEPGEVRNPARLASTTPMPPG